MYISAFVYIFYENTAASGNRIIGLMVFMLLRAHHAMCILNYRGKGYSEEFVQNMDALVRKLEPQTIIKLVREADSVCSACLNRTDITAQNPAGCVFSEKVERYDMALLSRLGIPPAMEIRWKELSELVRERILASESVFDSICGDCEWHEFCKLSCSGVSSA